MPAVQEKQEKMRFVVLQGKHHEGSKTDGSYRRYVVGDEVETSTDLVKIFGREKFMRLHPGQINPIEANKQALDDELSAKSIPELKALAADLEIDLGGAKTKGEILATLKAEME